MLTADKSFLSPEIFSLLSALFSDLFDLYLKHHNIKGLHDMSIKIDAIDRPLFMHFIARDIHMPILEKIAYDMKISYSK